MKASSWVLGILPRLVPPGGSVSKKKWNRFFFVPRLFQIGGKWGNSIACLSSKRDGFERINSKKHGLKFEGTQILQSSLRLRGAKGTSKGRSCLPQELCLIQNPQQDIWCTLG